MVFNQIIRFCIIGEGQVQAVVALVVRYEQGKVHGIVCNQFGGGCAEHVQLRLGPLEFVHVEGQFRVFEFGGLSQSVVWEILFNLAVQQRGLPNLLFRVENVSQQQFAACLGLG